MTGPRRARLVLLLLFLVGGLGVALVYCINPFGNGVAGEPGHGHPPLPPSEAIADLPNDGGPEFNRLVFESSPYLLQHARNPVDWYPWGEEAFAKARREDKPIFLSVGYSTCHWCHVMERESFENEAIARIMNEHFVSIKVDREERPDVDAIYMSAVQAMTGSGGWPMSVFLFPDGKPFWGGTYFPPEDRFGRPGFKTVLERIDAMWKNRREDLAQGAEQLTQAIRSQAGGGGTADLGVETLREGYDLYASSFDPDRGGFGSAPKFPRSHSLSFLLRYHARTGEARALAMVETTLDRMARGGMYDHVGGGFHRYSTDRDWLVPHFEKMLYDQALLARTYLEAYQVTGNERYADVARNIFRYVLRDMTDERGGFHSAEDADSEGIEGKFYVWTHAEILDALGEEDGTTFARAYGVTEDGNYREEGTGEETGANILHRPAPVPAGGGRDEARLSGMRERLFEVREGRIHPHKDDKVLTDWNGLMIGALAYGGRVLDEPRYTEAARRAAAFLLETMHREDGRLLHRYRDGNAAIPGYLDDYAFLVLGLHDLYEAGFEVRWLAEAERLAEEMVRLFWDTEGKGFHLAGHDGERLIARTKDLYDGAIPSGNSAATLALLRIGRMTMNRDLEARAEEALVRFSGEIDRFPMGYPFILSALDFSIGPSQEVVLAGNPDTPGIPSMRRAIYDRFLPNLVLALHPEEETESEGIVRLVPFLREQRAVDGLGTAYVCENYACNLPTTDVERMIDFLEGRR